MFPTFRDFLVSYWVANPITYDLKQDVLLGLVISTIQNSSVGITGLKPVTRVDLFINPHILSTELNA